jgi:hypothetical protein
MTAVTRPEPGPRPIITLNDPASITVEVDRRSASSRGRPPEHARLTRLRHADKSVVVAIGLNRPAADRLAAHATDIINPTATTQQ